MMLLWLVITCCLLFLKYTKESTRKRVVLSNKWYYVLRQSHEHVLCQRQLTWHAECTEHILYLAPFPAVHKCNFTSPPITPPQPSPFTSFHTNLPCVSGSFVSYLDLSELCLIVRWVFLCWNFFCHCDD